MVWTDERMDDLASRMDVGFTRVDGDIRDLRAEMHAGFKDLRTEVKDVRDEIKDVRDEMHTGFKDMRDEVQHGLAKVHAEVAELRSMMFRFGITMMAAMFGVIATLAAAIVTGSFIS